MAQGKRARLLVITLGTILCAAAFFGQTAIADFHVMDSPSPLLSNGLPYVFTSFEGQGVLRDEKPLSTGGEVNIDNSALAGPHEKQLPLNHEVVSFP